MSTPTIKHVGRGGSPANLKTNGHPVILLSTDKCGRCGDKGHLMSDHVEEKVRQCNLCACVAQDTEFA